MPDINDSVFSTRGRRESSIARLIRLLIKKNSLKRSAYKFDIQLKIIARLNIESTYRPKTFSETNQHPYIHGMGYTCQVYSLS